MKYNPRTHSATHFEQNPEKNQPNAVGTKSTREGRRNWERKPNGS